MIKLWHRTKWWLFPGIVVFAGLGVWAGGHVSLFFGNPAANKDTKAAGALMLVQVTGCATPESVTVRATAEGIVDGQRRSVPLETVRLGKPEQLAVTGSLPEAGRWVLSVTAKWTGQDQYYLVPLAPDGGPLRSRIRNHQAPFRTADVEATIRETPLLMTQARK